MPSIKPSSAGLPPSRTPSSPYVSAPAFTPAQLGLAIAWISSGLCAPKPGGLRRVNALPVGAASLRDGKILVTASSLAAGMEGLAPLQCPALALLQAHAEQGVSLRGATCCLWPGFMGRQGLELLLASAVRAVVLPDAPIPMRLEEEWTSCRFLADRLGVNLTQVLPRPFFYGSAEDLVRMGHQP